MSHVGRVVDGPGEHVDRRWPHVRDLGEAAGRRDVARILRPHDVIVGISASGRAPYVLGGLQAGQGIAATTVGITGNAASALARQSGIAIVIDVGPEIIAGSSRLKAGTATKLVLNMLSTSAMVRSGRTRDDLMVDMRPSNAKLRERAVAIVRAETGVDEAEARSRLEAAGWSVREAIDRQR
jgi:N-acetylmuramic acid 6-phosphate etherase